jgi:hypothetical protein
MKSKFRSAVLIFLAVCLTAFLTTCGGGDDETSGAPATLPTVVTTAISGNLTFTPYIAGTSARGGGNVTSDGGGAITDRGLCYNTTGNPTIGDFKRSDGSGTGVFTTCTLNMLAMNSVYHVRSYATNSVGTAYGNEITFNSGYATGDSYAGGLVFYNDGNGGGLVSAPSDQSTANVWIAGSGTQTTMGYTSTAIGKGLDNTNAIVGQSGHTGSAAQVCLDYSDSTYNDWFLPSLDELNLMYTKLHLQGIGSFDTTDGYWSSSEVSNDATLAWGQAFSDGDQADTNKGYTQGNVRAVRAF